MPTVRDVANLQQRLERLMQESVVGRPLRTIRAVSELGKAETRADLPVDIYTTASEFVIVAAVPGLEPAGIAITWDRGKVTLRGTLPDPAQSEEGKSATWVTRELSTGAFERTITLPVEVDAERAIAVVEDGLLMLRMPRTDAAKVRQIAVQAAPSGAATTSKSGETGS